MNWLKGRLIITKIWINSKCHHFWWIIRQNKSQKYPKNINDLWITTEISVQQIFAKVLEEREKWVQIFVENEFSKEELWVIETRIDTKLLTYFTFITTDVKTAIQSDHTHGLCLAVLWHYRLPTDAASRSKFPLEWSVISKSWPMDY